MDSLEKIVSGQDLSKEEAKAVALEMAQGAMEPERAGAFLTALRMTGECAAELEGFASMMREGSVRIKPSRKPLVDTCGTGGDSSGTFNISTCAAIVAAGAGVAIAKHGNRSVSSRSGSFDVLEELRVRPLEPGKVEECIDKTGLGFMYAPLFHPTTKNIMGARKSLGFRTIFNMLGPLTNPAGAPNQVVGVYDPALTERFAKVLGALGAKHALVVHSDGLDELGLGISKVSELRDGDVRSYEIDAQKLKFRKRRAPTVHSKEESARMILSVLHAKKGAERDITVLNAAAAIYVGGKSPSIKEALDKAEDSIDTGKAFNKLEEVRAFCAQEG